MTSTGRVVLWFSNGAASAVAARIALQNPMYHGRQFVLATISIPTEHPDNARFTADISNWLGLEAVELKSDKYSDPWDVYTRTRFLKSAKGARCTTELKKIVRRDFQRPDDTHVFGYCYDKREMERVARQRNESPELDIDAPLITNKITKEGCLNILEAAGIDLPAMYKLGYRNNNCIGCVKGGMGYWNKIRVDFPEVFERMSAVEKSLGHTVLRKDKKPLFLADLDPQAGRYEPLDSGCDLLCGQ